MAARDRQAASPFQVAQVAQVAQAISKLGAACRRFRVLDYNEGF